MRPQRGTLYFVGHEDTGAYQLTPVQEGAPSYTKAQIAELERQGYQCSVITICWVENWRDSPAPDGVTIVNWPE
jgi:hypothetical protein